jgi:hypothetical protein
LRVNTHIFTCNREQEQAMQFNRVFTAFSALAGSMRASGSSRALEIDLGDFNQPSAAERAMMGVWVADGGATRLSLLPNGRYDKTLETGRDIYHGRYEVDGSRLYFEGDTGRTAIGETRRGILVLGDHRFVRPGARSAA